LLKGRLLLGTYQVRQRSTVEPLYNGRHWEPTPNSGLWYICSRYGMRDQGVEPNVTAFWNFPLLYAGREG